MGNGIFRKLTSLRLLPPRETEFFTLLEKLVDAVAESSHWLTELFLTDRSHGHELAQRIELTLTRCVQIGQSLEDLLNRAQQPPFARGDINQFSDDCMKIAKFVNHAANRYVIYDIPSSDKEMRELGTIIKEACDLIVEAVKALRRDRNLDPFSRAVDELETRADEIYHGGLHRRFQEIRSDRNSLEARLKEVPQDASTETIVSLISANVEYTRHVAVFFILRQVYAELERAIDACRDATGTLKRMVADNV